MTAATRTALERTKQLLHDAGWDRPADGDPGRPAEGRSENVHREQSSVSFAPGEVVTPAHLNALMARLADLEAAVSQLRSQVERAGIA
jgi:hypothetical protein